MATLSEEELKQKHEGKWVILLADGSYYVADTPGKALAQAPRDATIKDIFRSPRKGELLLF